MLSTRELAPSKQLVFLSDRFSLRVLLHADQTSLDKINQPSLPHANIKNRTKQT